MEPAPATLTLSIHNRIEDLAACMDRAKGFLSDCRIDAGDCVQVMIMLDELGSNIIKSAWPGGGEHRFSMVLGIDDGGEMALRIVDDGLEFDPTQMAAPDLDASLEDRVVGGLGLFMVREMSDRMEYTRADGHNHLLVTKRLQREQASEGAG